MVSREPRYAVDILIDCSTKDLFLANRMTNISRGGMFIQTRLPLDAEIDLRFKLPGSELTIDARGRVVWNYDIRRGSVHLVAGSGIRFTEMEPEHRAALESCLRALAGPVRLAASGPARATAPPAPASPDCS